MGLFTAKGCLRRRSFFVRIPLLYALGLGFYSLPSLFPSSKPDSPAEIVASLGIALAFYLVVVQALRRLHDLDLSAWWVFIAFLPLVSYVLGAGLQFVQGTIGPNRFGPDPKRPALRAPTPDPTAQPEKA